MGEDTFVVRYHRIHVQGLRLPPGRTFYQVISELFGLDALNQERLRLICKGTVVDEESTVEDLRAGGRQPPVLMVMFPRGRVSVTTARGSFVEAPRGCLDRLCGGLFAQR